ncbi:MAG: response regulator transcription factor [Nitrospirota bacterium]
MRVLFIEDSERLQHSIGTGLRKAGFAVDAAGDGEQGLYLAEINSYDVILLDLMLPRVDGLTILKRLRDGGKDAHILILTARHTLEEKVKGLRLGADDYLTKPFAFDELLARIQALIRRRYQTKCPEIRIGDLHIDTNTGTVERNGRAITLSPKEYMLLEFLALRQGSLVSRSDIEAHIYDERVDPMSNVVDAAVCRLRKKINLPGCSNLIHTRRGLGYLLEDGGE